MPFHSVDDKLRGGVGLVLSGDPGNSKTRAISFYENIFSGETDDENLIDPDSFRGMKQIF